MNNYKKIMIKILISLVILSVIFVGISMLWDYFIVKKNITLEPSSGMTITLGTQYRDLPSIKEKIATTTSKQSLRLVPGNYVVSFSAEGFQPESKIINLNKDINVLTPALNYDKKRLVEILEKEKPAIHSVIYSVINKSYVIKSESLFKQANWYSASLIPDNKKSDNLKIILNKKNNSWEIAVKPTIVISIDDYPKIPQDVIRATNRISQEEGSSYNALD